MSHLLILYSNSPIEIAPQILLFANPSVVSVDANGSAALLLTLKRLNHRGLVSLVANNLPTDVTASFSPTSLVNDEEFVTVTVNAGPSAAAGTTTVQIEASGVGVLNATVDLSVTVATPSFAIDVDPDNPIVNVTQASSAVVPVHVNRLGGYTGTVTPSVSGLPTNVSGSFSPATLVHPAADAVLNLAAQISATPGTSVATIAADGAGVLQATVPLQVTVLAAPVGNPTPSGTILIDTRAGGNADIQACTTGQQARLAIAAQCRDNSNNGGDCDFVGIYGSSGTVNGALAQNAFGGSGYLGWNWTNNFNGSGTKAFRFDHQGYGMRATTGYVKATTEWNSGGYIGPYLKFINGAPPDELFVQFKMWMGRTATGGGYDDPVMAGGIDRSSRLGRFAVCNEEIVENNSSRKFLLWDRANVAQGACGRYDNIWAGQVSTRTAGTGTVDVTPTTGNQATAVFSSSQSGLVGKLLRIDPEWELYEVVSGSGTTWTLATRYDPYGTIPAWSAKSFSIMTKRTAPHRVNGNVSLSGSGATYCGAQTGMPQNPVAFNQTGVFDINGIINQELVYTSYQKVASSMSANDGISRIWCNGELISERTDINYGSYGFDHLQIGSTFQKPRWNQTEYIWDIVIWKP